MKINFCSRLQPVSVKSNGYLSKIEIKDILSYITTKQTQYFSLWAVYTAVQFSAGSFGFNLKEHLSYSLAMAAVLAVWVFNIGHLEFVLQCSQQLHMSGVALQHMLDDSAEGEDKTLNVIRESLQNAGSAGFTLPILRSRCSIFSLFINTFVHLFIDLRATVAILTRLDHACDLFPILRHLPIPC